jgi:protein-tyrosine sulfotransferase
MASSHAPEPKLVVLVSAARSGTTLLRLILDSHREVGAPAEAGIPSLIAHLGRVWATVAGAPPVDCGDAGVGGLSPHARKAVRSAALAPMADYCRREGKRIYCDKSLDSVYHLGAVHALFPDAKYIVLMRHVMDTVASGIEASPWGFNAYGYLPFVHASPDNFVAALVSYWHAHVDRAVAWERAHPERCHRLRYEDLVSNPEATLSALFAFLDVPDDPSARHRALHAQRPMSGPGDYKVGHTREIHSDAIGRGRRVPVEMIPPLLLEQTNGLLSEFGYSVLGRDWNFGVRPSEGVQTDESAGTALVALMDRVRPQSLRQASVGSFALVADDAPGLRWTIDPATSLVRHGDGEVDFAVVGATGDLARFVRGDESVGVLIRSGRLRYVTGSEPPRHPSEAASALEAARRVLHDAAVGDADTDRAQRRVVPECARSESS